MSIVIGLVLGVVVFVGGYVALQQFRVRCVPNCAEANFSRLSLYRPFPEGSPEARPYLLTLDGTDFTGADLVSADFRGISMRGATFDEANLIAVNFNDTALTEASFVNATLERGRFLRADLREATFTGADLSLADFTDARLQGADFTEADLFGITLEGALYDDTTLWPPGFDPQGAGAIPQQGDDL